MEPQQLETMILNPQDANFISCNLFLVFGAQDPYGNFSFVCKRWSYCTFLIRWGFMHAPTYPVMILSLSAPRSSLLMIWVSRNLFTTSQPLDDKQRKVNNPTVSLNNHSGFIRQALSTIIMQAHKHFNIAKLYCFYPTELTWIISLYADELMWVLLCKTYFSYWNFECLSSSSRPIKTLVLFFAKSHYVLFVILFFTFLKIWCHILYFRIYMHTKQHLWIKFWHSGVAHSS